MGEKPSFNPNEPKQDDFIEVTGPDGTILKFPKNKVTKIDAVKPPEAEHIVRASSHLTEPMPSGPATRKKTKK